MGRTYENIRSKKGLLHGYTQRLGRVAQIVEQLTPEQIDWIMRDIPKDMTIAEAIGSVVIDAYYNEHD